MYRHNSTIKIKQRECVRCGKVRYIFSKGMCEECAKIERFAKARYADVEDELIDEGLSGLIRRADWYFSKLVRLSAADEKLNVECYTCKWVGRWTDLQCGHFVSRKCLYLRFDQRNCKPQCGECNELKNGNLKKFSKRLELENPGIVDILNQEAVIIYKPTRSEMYDLIADFKKRLDTLKTKNL